MKKENAMTAIAVSKSLLKEYETRDGRTVYLDGDTEFQIKLFNPTTHRIGAEVFVNEERIGSPIILRPGEIVWLERYINEARKFKFDVYEVNMQQTGVKEAIKNNGQVKVKFFREREKINISCPTIGLNNYLFNQTPHLYTSNTSYSMPKYESDNSEALLNELTTSASFSLSISPLSDVNTYKSRNISSRIEETGRVSQGGYSNQKFDTIDIDLEYYPFETEEIKLLPKSQKPVTKDDLEKVYCHECGRKLKTKFKFCPFCGAKQ